MDRRTFATRVWATLASASLAQHATAQHAQAPRQPTEADADRSMTEAMRGPRQQIAMLVYPQFTALDLIGPHTFLSTLMNCDVHLVWKDKNPVPLDRGGTAILPTRTMDECPRDLDILFVPGGLGGTVAVMEDNAVLDFIADRGSRAKYVTSVCTGSLVLGCAGLLQGYKATSHWATRKLLPLLGATRVDERVVQDRNRITGGGVTSGIDFALTLASIMRGQTYAEMLQLVNEYDPQPPFSSGTPGKAGPGLTAHLEKALAPGVEKAREVCTQKQRQLKV